MSDTPSLPGAGDEDHSNEENRTVKRSMVLTVGVLSLGLAVWFASKLWADPAARPAASTQTRVAMLNLRWVIKNYSKYTAFIETMKKEEQKYVNEIKLKQAAIDKIAKEGERLGPMDAAGREAKEQEIRDLQRQIEDVKLKARKDMAQRGNDEMVKVYKEIRNASYRHAQANGFDLVFHFEGPGDEKEVDSPVLVMKNINAGGCVPLYWNSALDISGPVLKALNSYAPNK